jgi:RNA polymerase sigma factor (sigma-70 family)
MRQGQLRAVLGYLHRVANPATGSPTDDQLLNRWRNQRDPAAFEVLVWRHGALVWNVCRRTLGREQDVEDAFQATFLTFLRKSDTIGHGRCLGSWLYKVAYRTALAARAASARHTVHEQPNADVLETAAIETDDWDDLGPVLDEEIHRLPEKYRRPFVLCYLEGKTTDEAARDLGCPRGTVGTRLAWARERLRVRLTRRGLALSAAALAALLTEKAAMASVPAPLVASMVKAATLSAAGKAMATGVISARAAALAQGVLHAMFLTKLKTAALVLLTIGILGSRAGLLAHHALAGLPDRETRRPGVTETRRHADEPALSLAPPLLDSLSSSGDADEEDLVFAGKDKAPPAPDKGGNELRQLSGTVVRVDRDGNTLDLDVRSKAEGEAPRKAIKITDRTLLTFSNVGPNEAGLTEGYRADVWLEKDSKDLAARVHLNGNRNPKNMFHRAGRVFAVAADGNSITLERQAKGEPAEQIAIQLTEKTRVSFSNIARGGATMAVGYEGRVLLANDAVGTAKAVTFFGSADEGPAEGKDPKPDRSGKIVGLSGSGKVLSVEVFPAKAEGAATTAIKLTDATRESYHGVAAGDAQPAVGYLVQVWLAEASPDTAVRVRFFRNDPRPSVDARILSVAADGDRLTLAIAPRLKGGELARREIQVTAGTRLIFANVGPGGARLTAGDLVRGWLVEGSEDTADELLVSRSEKPHDK